ncbi:MAG: NUDIX domain-containing protein [Clostridiaceae bacterium]|nr:NUDIX domain-containing protein [Clostridiaceae bacterium]
MNSERFMMPVAVHLFLLQDNKIVLLRRFNTGYEDGKYSVIAGHLDGNEDLKSAMAREALEEAGIIIELKDLEIIGVFHRKTATERVDFFLMADKWKGKITNMEKHMCDDLSWHNLDSLPDNMIPYVRKAIENYRYGINFDMYGW